MNTNTILIIIVSLVIGGIAGYLLNTQMMHERGSGMMHQMSDGSMMDNNHDMGRMQGMDHMMEMMVSSERKFIEGMIPHHQEAIDTAKEVLERGGTTPEIRNLAQNIITAQAQEIEEMKQWYKDWYNEPYTDQGTYTPMMRELSKLSGKPLDRTFLEDMIAHHMGAIMMAQSVHSYIEHQEIENLTQAIVATQSKEIQHMQKILKGL